ncbi:hypothetical protein V8F20_008692 [Naviculisporaceae sp. PSN 640]
MARSFSLYSLLALGALTRASPVCRRAVDALNDEATAEAHRRDDSATRAFSNVQIKTSDGRCLFVDKLSGDFRANLTPIQVAACGSSDGQGWDVITKGAHIDVDNSMLIVSTLTQACFNFDDRRAAGNQVLLFSCGGRADGGGQVTSSQVFSFDGSPGPLFLKPQNAAGQCLTVKGDVVDIASCDNGDSNQSFTFGDSGGAVGGGNNENGGNGNGNGDDNGNGNGNGQGSSSTACTKRTRTVTTQPTAIPTPDVDLGVELPDTTSSASLPATSSGAGAGNGGGNGGIPSVNPTDPVPVSRAGGRLNPTAAAEAHQRDDTATRAFSNVEIRAPDGKCLFIDPTAGDFRQNLIPVSTVKCSGSPNEKWDIITAGKHNNQNGNAPAALIVSALTNGCISFDGRRQAGDTVTLFSCGGRGDGGGETDSGQLMPFIGQLSFAFAPQNQNNQICILPGNGRLESGPCPTNGAQLFSIFP